MDVASSKLEGVLLDLSLLKKMYCDFEKDKNIVNMVQSRIRPEITMNTALFNYVYDFYNSTQLLPHETVLEEKFNIKIGDIPSCKEDIGYLMVAIIDRYLKNIVGKYLESSNGILDNKDITIKDIISPMSRIVKEYERFYNTEKISYELATSAEAVSSAKSLIGKKGIYSPWESFNKTFPGLFNNNILAIGGRLESGKTFVMCKWVLHLLQNHPTAKILFINSEMDKSEIILRLVSLLTGYFSTDLMRGKIPDEDWDKINNTFSYVDTVGKNRLFIMDAGFNSKYDFINEVVESVMPDIIFIDGIYLFSVSDYVVDRMTEMPKIAREIKKTSNRFNVPVIFTTQLNREATKEEPSPTHFALSDEFMWHSSYGLYLKTDAQYKRNREIGVFICKSRHGHGGKFILDAITFEEKLNPQSFDVSML